LSEQPRPRGRDFFIAGSAHDAHTQAKPRRYLDAERHEIGHIIDLAGIEAYCVLGESLPDHRPKLLGVGPGLLADAVPKGWI